MPTHLVILFGLLVFSLVPDSAFAGPLPVTQGFNGFGDPEFLEVDQAFQLSSVMDEEQVIVRWWIAPGYYLYKHRLQFRARQAEGDSEVFEVLLPAGKKKHDEYFGDVETYYRELELNVPRTSTNVEITVQYQGCADAGLCYPPQTRTLSP